MCGTGCSYDGAVRWVFIALAVVGAMLTGCGGSGSDQIVRTGTLPVARKADGTLASNPPPLTVADVEKEPAGSARRAVMQLIFWAQWGNLPAIVDAYDNRVVESVGVTRIVGTYDLIRADLLSSRPRIVAQRPTGDAQFVAVEFSRAHRRPVAESFVVHRRDGAWRVAYDTLLGRNIEGFVHAQQAPGDASPSAAVRRIGQRAVQRYRDLYPSLVRAQRRARSR